MRFETFSTSAEIQTDDAYELALIASKYVWLPNVEVIKQLGAVAYFPTARRSHRSEIVNSRKSYGNDEEIILDKNGSPGWALLWPHGLREKPTGWRIAHVWDGYAKEPEAFSNPANLCLISGPLMCLTDYGKGYTPPLMEYLKYHAHKEYKWRPENAPVVEKPQDYDEVASNWNYLPMNGDPSKAIMTRFQTLDNAKVNAIRELEVTIPWRTT